MGASDGSRLGLAIHIKFKCRVIYWAVDCFIATEEHVRVWVRAYSYRLSHSFLSIILLSIPRAVPSHTPSTGLLYHRATGIHDLFISIKS
jgi:hypothetical protein